MEWCSGQPGAGSRGVMIDPTFNALSYASESEICSDLGDYQIKNDR